MQIDLHMFEKLAGVLAPIVLPMFGVSPEVVNLVVHAMQVAQGIDTSTNSGLSGAAKKAVAMDIVHAGLKAADSAVHDGVHVEALMDGVSDGIDATVAAIKAGSDVTVGVSHPAVNIPADQLE